MIRTVRYWYGRLLFIKFSSQFLKFFLKEETCYRTSTVPYKNPQLWSTIYFNIKLLRCILYTYWRVSGAYISIFPYFHRFFEILFNDFRLLFCFLEKNLWVNPYVPYVDHESIYRTVIILQLYWFYIWLVHYILESFICTIHFKIYCSGKS